MFLCIQVGDLCLVPGGPQRGAAAETRDVTKESGDAIVYTHNVTRGFVYVIMI